MASPRDWRPGVKLRAGEALHREISSYLSRHHRGEAYGFNIKIRRVNIPDEVREALSESQINDAYEVEASHRVEDFADSLKDEFPWIHEWFQEGRSGGWLVLVPDTAVLGEDGDIEDVRLARKRLIDLANIATYVEEAKKAFKSDMESLEWWEEYGIS